jgi:hypothetical protein
VSDRWLGMGILGCDLMFISCPLVGSGISVQNPDRPGVPGGNMVRDLLRRAAEYVSFSFLGCQD